MVFLPVLNPNVLVEHTYYEVDEWFFYFSVSNITKNLKEKHSEFNTVDLRDIKKGEDIAALDPCIICLIPGLALVVILHVVIQLCAGLRCLMSCLLQGKGVGVQDKRVDNILEEF